MIRRACYRFVTHDGGRRGVTPMRPDEGSPRARAASVPNGDSRIVRLGGPAGARGYPGIEGSNRREPLLVPLLATALASPIAANGDLGICHRYVHHPTRGTCGESFDVECLFHLIHPNHPAGTLSPSQDPALFNVREHAAARCSHVNSARCDYFLRESRNSTRATPAPSNSGSVQISAVAIRRSDTTSHARCHGEGALGAGSKDMAALS